MTLRKGLVMHHMLDQESLQSATTFADKTPYENVGTSANVPVFTSDRMGQPNRATSFDGTSDVIEVPDSDSLNITDALSYGARVKGIFADGAYHMIARKGDTYGSYLAIHNHHIYSRIWTDDVWKTVEGSTILNDDQYYHLLMSYDKDVGNERTGLDDFDELEADTNNPVIPVGTSEDWDEHIGEIGNVIYDADGGTKKYRTFYTGHQGSYVGNEVYIGYAYSADGITWTKAGKVITRALEDPYVVKNGSTYYLFAEDKEDVPFRNIRRYHSSDCETWTDDGDVLDVQSGGTPTDWEASDVSSPIVWIENGTWYMFYEGRGGGYGGKIGLATSSDGLNWVRDANNPVFDAGETGEWDDTNVVSDDIIKIDGVYYLCYHGYGSETVTWACGMATSSDLYNWTRYTGNPIAEGTWTIMVFYDTEYVFHYETSNVGIGRYYPYILSAPRLYIDGIEDKYDRRDDCNNNAIVGSEGLFRIGASWDTYNDKLQFLLNGALSDLRYYNISVPEKVRTALVEQYRPKLLI